MTNLRFADDVLLVAANRTDVGKMIDDLKKEASKYGLRLHMGKTKVLTNCSVQAPMTVSCGTTVVKVLNNDESEKYLGRKLATHQYHQTEFDHRLASGWAAFFKFKDALCNRNLPLKHRVKLF